MTYKKELDLNLCWLWSFVIRSRAGFKCELYGKDDRQCFGNLQAAHIVTRGVKGIKFELRNGRCLCAAHHRYFTNRVEFWSAIVSRLWSEDWLYLTMKKWQEPTMDIDKEALFAELFLEAQKYIGTFHEYRPKLENIGHWATKEKTK